MQFDALFTDGLYQTIGAPVIQAADQIRAALEQCGYPPCFHSPTNQVFCLVKNDLLPRLAQQVDFGYWESRDDGRTVIRFAASWATTPEHTTALCALLLACLYPR